MWDNKALGLALIIIGVVGNNYVYLHDFLLDKHEGGIILGWQSFTAIVVTLIVVAAGLVVVGRAGGRSRAGAAPTV